MTTPDAHSRVAVVTGASAGIGEATARTLAAQGFHVVAVARRADRIQRLADEIGGTAVVADVTDGAAVDALAAGLTRVDVLVNNAGGTFVAPFLDIAPKGEASIIAENFTQVTHFVRRVAPLMTDGGSIINLTSIEAHQAGPGFSVYAAMKAAVANITGTLALELGGRNIRVNAIASDAQPSGGEKEARKAMLDAEPEYMPAFTPPLGYFGTPEDSAAAALFLASDLSRFITGTTLHVDGGNRAAGGWHRPVSESALHEDL